MNSAGVSTFHQMRFKTREKQHLAGLKGKKKSSDRQSEDLKSHKVSTFAALPV